MTAVIEAPVGIQLAEPLLPGSPEWLTKVSASKIAALLGLSTYESPFSLWHRMTGLIDPEPDDDEKRRGHYLEPAIVAWFADQHSDWTIEAGGSWVHRHRDWQSASPDRLVIKPGHDLALLEVKSANGADGDEWGEPGTNQIPPGVLAQCLWQLDVTGFDTCHVAVLGPYLTFAEYVVVRDEREMAFMREKALAFLGSIERRERPSIDDHGATYEALRNLHPLIDPVKVEIDADLAVEYCRARHTLKASEARAQLATSRLAEAMGNAKTAVLEGRPIAGRQARGDKAPYVVAARGLPYNDEESTS